MVTVIYKENETIVIDNVEKINRMITGNLTITVETANGKIETFENEDNMDVETYTDNGAEIKVYDARAEENK